jgi:thioredoxin:protein disulfide reductase
MTPPTLNSALRGSRSWLPRLVTALVVTTGLCAGAAQAKPWWLRGVETNEADFLPPDVAFRVRAVVDGPVIHARWVIADGYYLYRSRIDVKPESPDLNLSSPNLPPGIPKDDPYLGHQEIYERQAEATVAYERSDGGAHPIQIKVTYQGCAEAGLCYPPITKVLFPTEVAVAVPEPSHGWERGAILAGGFAFLIAGLALRKGRNLELPPA